MMARAKLPPMPETTWQESKLFPPGPRPHHINHFGISGGKDSTALILWALHESGYPRESIDTTFCDTLNESPITYQYIDYLEQTLQIGITRITPPLGFFELAKRKKRFPSTTARFCTYWLKIKPTIDYINATFRAGHTLTLHSGVRAQESDARKKMLEREYDGNFLCEIVRPLLKLKIGDIWAMHEKYSIKPNPLYAMGMTRVGCFPCIMSRKKEIHNIAQRFPEAIDKIRIEERNFPDGKEHSFFAAPFIPDRFHSRTYTNRHGKIFSVATIDDVVAWAASAKGAKLDPRFNPEMGLEYDQLPDPEGPRCQSGFCE